MAELDIDPGGWDDPDARMLTHLLDGYGALRDFVRETASAGEALIIHVG